jgi:outer membrane lipoprotein
MRIISLKGLLLLGLLTAVFGCAPGISREARTQVTYDGPFEELQRQPQKFDGEIVMLGGKIIRTDVDGDATELVVLQMDLDRAGRPMDTDRSAGRFVVRTPQFLDPELYPEGLQITVVGQKVQSEERLIGNMPYRYPIIEPIEITKWPRQVDRSSRFHFGIGVGTRF